MRFRDGGVVEDTGDDGQVVCPGARKGGAVCDRGPTPKLLPQAIIVMILKCRSIGNTKAVDCRCLHVRRLL